MGKKYASSCPRSFDSLPIMPREVKADGVSIMIDNDVLNVVIFLGCNPHQFMDTLFAQWWMCAERTIKSSWFTSCKISQGSETERGKGTERVWSGMRIRTFAGEFMIQPSFKSLAYVVL